MQPTKVWQGIIVLAFKTGPLEVLLIENRQTGNITPISGELESKWNESGEEAAIRHTRIHTGWRLSEDMFVPTNIYHRFKYGPFKPERAEHYTSSRLFLLNASGLSEPASGSEAEHIKWLAPEAALAAISFPDLQKLTSRGLEEIAKL